MFSMPPAAQAMAVEAREHSDDGSGSDGEAFQSSPKVPSRSSSLSSHQLTQEADKSDPHQSYEEVSDQELIGTVVRSSNSRRTKQSGSRVRTTTHGDHPEQIKKRKAEQKRLDDRLRQSEALAEKLERELSVLRQMESIPSPTPSSKGKRKREKPVTCIHR